MTHDASKARSSDSTQGSIQEPAAEGLRDKLEDFAVWVMIVSAMILKFLVIAPIRRTSLWFRQHVYDGAAPFRSVRGPYVLVLRSFGNRMATGQRFTRVFDKPDGRVEVGPPWVQEMPKLTVIDVLLSVSEQLGNPLVAVSNDSSLSGALRLVHTKRERWFEAVRILATHARAIVVIPDGTSSLLKEIECFSTRHAMKLFILMPPSSDRVELRSYIDKDYVVEDVDFSEAWAETQRSLGSIGVKLPDYESRGGIVLWKDDATGFSWLLPWDRTLLTKCIAGCESEPSAADRVRAEFRAAGLRFLRYPMPPEEGETLDELLAGVRRKRR